MGMTFQALPFFFLVKYSMRVHVFPAVSLVYFSSPLRRNPCCSLSPVCLHVSFFPPPSEVCSLSCASHPHFAFLPICFSPTAPRSSRSPVCLSSSPTLHVTLSPCRVPLLRSPCCFHHPLCCFLPPAHFVLNPCPLALWVASAPRGSPHCFPHLCPLCCFPPPSMLLPPTNL